MKQIMLILLVAVSNIAVAGEVGLRYNSLINTGGLFDLGFSNAGKIIEVKYDHSLTQNFFVEGATGGYFSADLTSPAAWVLEASVGVKVDFGPVDFRVSQGVGAFVFSGDGFQSPTHIALIVVDRNSGWSIGLERSHYSNGNTGGYDLTGVTFGYHF